jgi:hypothetical protein
MSDARDTLRDWRADLIAELAAAESALAVAETASKEAAVAEREEIERLGLVIGPILRSRETLAPPLGLRVDEVRAVAEHARSAATHARHSRDAACKIVADLHRALLQLDQALARND